MIHHDKCEAFEQIIKIKVAKIKDLEAKNVELEKRLDILVNHDIAGYKEGILELEKKLADEMGLSDRYLLRCQELEKKLEIAVEALNKFKEIRRLDGNGNEYEGREFFISNEALAAIKDK